MDQKGAHALFLGLDIGRINTRAAYFGLAQGKYRLLGCESASTSLSQGLHIGAGAAMQKLQTNSEREILNSQGGLIIPSVYERGIDRVGMLVSAGPEIRTALLGVSLGGSLSAGKALLNSLPVKQVAVLGAESLLNESDAVNTLVHRKPDLILIAGGENGGAQHPVQRWVDIVHLVCSLVPEEIRPTVIFAGNQQVEAYARRRIEHLTRLKLASNIQPESGIRDLIPAQLVMEQEIIKTWQRDLTGLVELGKLSKELVAIKSQALNRMTRYFAKTKAGKQKDNLEKGVLAVDLGGGSTTISAALGTQSGIIFQPAWQDNLENIDDSISFVQRWSAIPASIRDVHQYLTNHTVHPGLVPESLADLAMSQALARHRLSSAARSFSEHHRWFEFSEDKGLTVHVEPIILSGAVFTQAPTIGEAALILLDGLQPWGITTLVLDRHQILPLLGVIASEQPILPVHLLESPVFEHLCTVITAVSGAKPEQKLMTIRVNIDSGKSYEVEIFQGTLRRLVIPPGVTAVLEINPARDTDVGFGGRGIGGQLKVRGGALGVVVDARGRPIPLADDDGVRVEQVRKWLWNLGG